MKKEDFYQQRVSQFQNLQSPQSRSIDLNEMVRLIKYDDFVKRMTEQYQATFDKHGKAKADSEVKQKQMGAVSVSVTFDGVGRRAEHIVDFTGLVMVDLDHVDDVERVMALVCQDPHTLMAYRTVSGHGLHIIYPYEREQAGARMDATSWRAAFQKGNEHYARLTGCAYDRQCSDYQRLCGLAHDERPYVNYEAQPFTVTDEEIVAANFATATEKGKPRRVYDQGTHGASADEAWPKVEQMLQRHGLVYEPGHRHDYVMHAAFLMNRYGVPLDELLDLARQQWADHGIRECEKTIRSCYRHTAEHGTWRLRTQGRKPKDTTANIMTLAEIHEWLLQRMAVRYNKQTDRIMWCALDGTEWQNMDERMVCTLRRQMAEDTGKRVLKSDVHDVLKSDVSQLVRPVNDYFKSLPPWDGRDRVKELAAHVGVEPAQAGQTQQEAAELMEWALHKWLVGMVATWLTPKVNHQIFVLIGPQGIYKTTFFRHLLPPALRLYFLENTTNSFSTKDDLLALAENCLVEIEEIDTQNQRELSGLKALATLEKVKVRRPYGHFTEEKPRLASFCGSGNQQHFLHDDTGNRRWLCFLVSHIDSPYDWTLDYDQLYAQLHHELNHKFRYWFTPSEQDIVERQNQAFRAESDEEQLIRARLRVPRVGDKVTLMNAATVCQFVNGGAVGRGLSSKKAAIIMKQLGFKLVRKMQGNFYEVYVIPADQLQATMAMSDDDEESEDAHTQPVEGDLPF